MKNYFSLRKCPKLFFLLLMPALSAVNLFAQTTITLQPDSKIGKDAYLWSIQPNGSFGDHPDILATEWTYGGDPDTVRSIFEFDFSSIPSDAIIQNATLSLYWSSENSNIGHYGDNRSYLCRITHSWDEHTVTWNNQPPVSRKNKVFLPRSRSLTQDYPDIDVTALVQDMVSKGNYGFMLRLRKEHAYESMKFASSDDADPSKHPKIVITYTTNSKPAKILTSSTSITSFAIYPNPSNGNTSASFTLDKASEVTVNLFDAQGRMIRTIMNGNLAEGSHQINIDSKGLNSGIYFLELRSEGSLVTKKLIVE